MVRGWLTALLPPVATLGLVVGMAIQKRSYATPEDASPYHEHLRELRETIPWVIGDWIGSEVSVPPAALALLRPNVLISRQYVNSKAGMSANLLIVQCGDARDMLGHYPPNCYPAHGMVMRHTRRLEREVQGRKIPLTQYKFKSMSFGESAEVIVDNFIVLPDGRIMPDMEEMRNSAADYQKRFYGAGQVQVVIDASVAAAKEEEVFQTLVGANLHFIDAMRMGVKP